MPSLEIQDLVHELQVHQVELQMQNEELRRMQEELQVSRQKYSDLYEFAPIGYLTLTREGIIVEANFLGSTWLGESRPKLKGRKLSDFITRRHQDEYFHHYRRVFDTGGRQSCEIELLPKGIFVQLNSQVHIPEDGYCCTTMTDITHLVEPNRPLRSTARTSETPAVQENTLY
jgi:PAS domain S-box-containing protein